MSDEKIKIPFINVAKVQPYRSKPDVSMADDMVRVTLDMPKWKWNALQRVLDDLVKD